MTEKLNKISSRITEPKSQGASQAMLYGIGMSDADMQKAQVGISSVWYEGNPCNMHLARLAEHGNVCAVKEASGDLLQAMEIVRATPDDFRVLSGEDKALLGGVSDEDRERYAQAKALFEAKDLEASWASLEPLLEKYPGNYAIQHFGCSLAMHVGARESAGSACRRAIDLAGTQ